MRNCIKVFYTSHNTVGDPLEKRVNEWLAEIHEKGWRVFGMKLNDELLIYSYTDEKHPHRES